MTTVITRHVERQRSWLGWACKWMFIITFLGGAWNVMGLVARLSDISSKARGFQHVAIASVGQSAIVNAMAVWLASAAFFGLLAYLTRGKTIVIETRSEAHDGEMPVPKPASRRRDG